MSLPLREFYPIDRAAELLECTVDDLKHWASFGNIDLYVNFNQEKGLVYIKDFRVYCNEINNIIGGFDVNKKLCTYQQIKHSLDNVSDFYYKTLNNEVSEFDKLDCYDSLRFIFSGYVFDEYGSVCNNNVSDKEKLAAEINETVNYMVNSDGEMARFFNDITVCGVFRIIDCNPNITNRFSDKANSFYQMTERKINFNLLNLNKGSYSDSELLISKKDFVKIKNASINGDDIGCGYDISSDLNEERRERVSNKHKIALQMFISKYHPEIVNNPSKLANVLSIEAKEAGLGGVSFDKATVSRWLKKDG